MALSVATLIDRAKALADRRVDSSIPDTDWLVYVNWAQEDLYRFIVASDPGAYFSTIDFTLAGGSAGATFNLDLAFDVRLVATSLPAYTAAGPAGAGHTLTEIGNGALLADGIAPTIGQRILYSATSVDGGIYQVVSPGSAGTPFSLVRATDFDQALPTEVQLGAVVTASEGNTLANSPMVLTSFTGVMGGLQTWTNLPLYTRFRALHGLDISPDTQNRLTVRGRNFRERNLRAIGWWTPTAFAQDRRYDLRGTMLVVTPYEYADGTYRAYYRAAPYRWSTPTDTDRMDPQLEIYDEWVVIKAAIKALKIEESDANPWQAELEMLAQSIISEHQRDDGEPAVIADVEDLG